MYKRQFLAVAIPYVPIPLVMAGLGLLLALPRGRRWLALGVLVVSLVAASAPWWRFPTAWTPRPTANALRVFSLNAEFGQADQDAILRLAASADILAFQENTPEFVQSLEDKGLLKDFPYRLGTAEYEAYGTMMWSRTPLTLVATGQTRYTSLVVHTTVHDTVWTVSTLHAVSPLDGSRAIPEPDRPRSALRVGGRVAAELRDAVRDGPSRDDRHVRPALRLQFGNPLPSDDPRA